MLLTLIRKSRDAVQDWEAALALLLYRYGEHPHSLTKVSPMEAMGMGTLWSSTSTGEAARMSDSAWVDRLRRHAARVHDHIEDELSALGCEEASKMGGTSSYFPINMKIENCNA